MRMFFFFFSFVFWSVCEGQVQNLLWYFSLYGFCEKCSVEHIYCTYDKHL